ncbi:MAG: ABC transporter substrate-binding protein [bacterium]|nr:ABC transporter substrate-binding protein [bacterium]
MIIALLACVTALGIIVFFTGTPGNQEPAPEVAQDSRPEWLAAPQVDQQDALAEKRAQPRALTVGVIGPLSGDEAEFGQAVLAGVSIAADRFNSLGGFQGEALKVVSYDNSGGSGQALAITEELIAQNVVAIFAAPTGWSTFAPTQMVNASETVFISVGTRRKIGRSGGYIFRLALPDEIAIDKTLSYVIDTLGYENLGLVNSSSYDYSLSVAAEFKRKVPDLGGQILVEADTYDTFSGKTEIKKVAAELNARSEELQAIIFTGNAQEAARLALANQDLGWAIPLIGGEDLFNEQFLKQGGKAVRGSLLYTTFAPDRDSALMRDFMSEFTARRNTNPDRFAALAFDAFNLLSQALLNANSLETQAVRDALLGLEEIEGVTGANRWASDGTPIKYPYFYRVEGSPAGEEFVLVK